MKVGSLFSGIGGIDLGLERAGMKVVWQVEKDPYCQKVLKKHWPTVPCYGDIKEIDFTTLPPVDLICGGFPCQPYSRAGSKREKNDERNLWPETFRCIRETEARWVMCENVPGLLDYEYFGRILGDLASLGLVVEWNCLSASAFNAPHKRERLFLLAYHHSERSRGICGGANKEQRNLGEYKPFGSLLDWNNAQYERTREFFREGTLPPRLCRVDDEIPSRVDRLKSLGNAVVPQVAEWIGRRIMDFLSPPAPPVPGT